MFFCHGLTRIFTDSRREWCFEPRMDTNVHESISVGLCSPRSVLLRVCVWVTLQAVVFMRSCEGRCVATDVFFATDEHGFSRIVAGSGV